MAERKGYGFESEGMMRQYAADPKGNDNREIFVGGIPIDMTETGLRQYMEAYGEVEQVYIETKGGFSRGFGRVSFREASVAAEVVSVKHCLRGRFFTCTFYLSPAEAKQRIENEKKRKIFVSGLKKTTNDNHLLKFFKRFGPVERVIINRYKDSISKGTAFILFFSEESVMNLVSDMNVRSHSIDGAWVTVFRCLSKNDIASFASANYQQNHPAEERMNKNPYANEISVPKASISTNSLSGDKEAYFGGKRLYQEENKFNKEKKKLKPTFKQLCQHSQIHWMKSQPSQEPQNLPRSQMSKRQEVSLYKVKDSFPPKEEDEQNLRYNIGPIHLQTGQQVRFLKWSIQVLGMASPMS